MEIQPEIVREGHKMVKDSMKGISLEEKAREKYVCARCNTMFVYGYILFTQMDLRECHIFVSVD